MASHYDVTTKSLLQAHPPDWLRFLGLNVDSVEIVDADLSTIVAEADKALLLKVPDREMLNVEFQSGFESDMIERFLEYSVLLRRRHRLPIRTIVILMRPQADRDSITETLELTDTEGRVYLTFHYRVIRIWDIPVSTILAAGVGTLPLAPLADLGVVPIDSVIRQMDSRIRAEESAAEADLFWTSTFLLLGLRYPADIAVRLIKGVRGMKESTTYQYILDEGRQEGRQEGRHEGEVQGAINEARELLIRIGTRRFGQPDSDLLARIRAIADRVTLERLVERVLDVANWQEILAIDDLRP